MVHGTINRNRAKKLGRKLQKELLSPEMVAPRQNNRVCPEDGKDWEQEPHVKMSALPETLTGRELLQPTLPASALPVEVVQSLPLISLFFLTFGTLGRVRAP